MAEVKTHMYLPDGYYTASIGFTGVYVPQGAAVTFQGQNAGNKSAQQIAVLIESLWPAVQDNLTDGCIASSCYVRLGADPDVGESYVEPMNDPGNVTTPAASPAVSYIVRKFSALGGKRGRGRMYVPGVAEANIDGAGTIAAGVITAFQTDVDTLLSSMVTNNIPMAIGHRYPEDWSGPKTSPSLVTKLTVEGTVATQRRRQRR